MRGRGSLGSRGGRESQRAQRCGGTIFVLGGSAVCTFPPLGARPRPSRSAGTFPLAWRGLNQPRCASRRCHVTRAGSAVLTRRLYLHRQPRGLVRLQGQKEPSTTLSVRFLPLPNMKKAEMGRFNISPDEDSSSYSSNSDFNYSYPTKQAALKRWEMCAFLKTACVHRKFFT